MLRNYHEEQNTRKFPKLSDLPKRLYDVCKSKIKSFCCNSYLLLTRWKWWNCHQERRVEGIYLTFKSNKMASVPKAAEEDIREELQKPNLSDTGRLRQFPSQNCRRILSIIPAGYRVLSILTHILGKKINHSTLTKQWNGWNEAQNPEDLRWWQSWGQCPGVYGKETSQGHFGRAKSWVVKGRVVLYLGSYRGSDLMHEHVQKLKADKINMTGLFFPQRCAPVNWKSPELSHTQRKKFYSNGPSSLWALQISKPAGNLERRLVLIAGQNRGKRMCPFIWGEIRRERKFICLKQMHRHKRFGWRTAAG